MQGYKSSFITMHTSSHRGPLVLIDGTPGIEDFELAGRILARYGQGRDADRVTVTIKTGNEESEIQVKPLPADQIPREWLV